VVKVSGEDLCIKEPKTKAGNRYVYFSPEMGALLKEYRRYCENEALHYEGRTITDNDFLFRKHELDEPMTPTTFTWRFKLILKKNDLPYNLNVHSLRHTNASLLISNGTDVATVSSLLGHAQVSSGTRRSRQRWTSTLTHSTKIKKPPATSCIMRWRYKGTRHGSPEPWRCGMPDRI